MQIGGVLIAGQRMADQHRVAAVRIQRAIGLVGDLEGSQLDAGIELKRLVGAEAHHRRMGMIGLAGAVGRIKCSADVGLDHLHNPAGEAEQPPILPDWPAFNDPLNDP